MSCSSWHTCLQVRPGSASLTCRALRGGHITWPWQTSWQHNVASHSDKRLVRGNFRLAYKPSWTLWNPLSLFSFSFSFSYVCILRMNTLTSWYIYRQYLVLNESVDSLQHPLTGELVGQVGFNLITQTQNADWSKEGQERILCVCPDMKACRKLKYQPAVCSLSFESCRPPQTPDLQRKTSNNQQLKPLLLDQVARCLLHVFVCGEEDEERRRGREREPSRSLVGCSSPRITKHMRLRGLVQWTKPLFRLARRSTTQHEVPSPGFKYAWAWTWRRNRISLSIPPCFHSSSVSGQVSIQAFLLIRASDFDERSRFTSFLLWDWTFPSS